MATCGGMKFSTGEGSTVGAVETSGGAKERDDVTQGEGGIASKSPEGSGQARGCGGEARAPLRAGTGRGVLVDCKGKAPAAEGCPDKVKTKSSRSSTKVMAEVPAEPAQTAVLREEDEKIAQDLRRQQMQEFLRWRQEETHHLMLDYLDDMLGRLTERISGTGQA